MADDFAVQDHWGSGEEGDTRDEAFDGEAIEGVAVFAAGLIAELAKN